MCAARILCFWFFCYKWYGWISDTNICVPCNVFYFSMRCPGTNAAVRYIMSFSSTYICTLLFSPSSCYSHSNVIFMVCVLLPFVPVPHPRVFLFINPLNEWPESLNATNGNTVIRYSNGDPFSKLIPSCHVISSAVSISYHLVFTPPYRYSARTSLFSHITIVLNILYFDVFSFEPHFPLLSSRF